MCSYVRRLSILVSVQFKFNMIIDYKGANYAMANKAAIYTDLKVAA